MYTGEHYFDERLQHTFLPTLSQPDFPKCHYSRCSAAFVEIGGLFSIRCLKVQVLFLSHLNLDLRTSYRKCIFLLAARIQRKKRQEKYHLQRDLPLVKRMTGKAHT